MSKHWLLLLLLAGAGAGCTSGGDTYRVAGRYYITLTEDGGVRFWFDDPDQGRVTLNPDAPAEVGVVGRYVVVQAQEFYYVFPATAQTATTARDAQIGMSSRVECRRKLVQLTGDTVRLGSVI